MGIFVEKKAALERESAKNKVSIESEKAAHEALEEGW
jgi:hypothetical protein